MFLRYGRLSYLRMVSWGLKNAKESDEEWNRTARNETNRTRKRRRDWQERSTTNISQSKLGHLYLFQGALPDSLTYSGSDEVDGCLFVLGPAVTRPLSKPEEAYETAGRGFLSHQPTQSQLELCWPLRNIVMLTLFQRPLCRPILPIDPLNCQKYAAFRLLQTKFLPNRTRNFQL